MLKTLERALQKLADGHTRGLDVTLTYQEVRVIREHIELLQETLDEYRNRPYR